MTRVIPTGADTIIDARLAGDTDPPLATLITSVKSFGATGDGVTDDLASIQAAIDSVAATGQGGTVYFPAGDYKVTGSITPASRVCLMGEGSPGITEYLAEQGTRLVGNFGGPIIDGGTTSYESFGIERMALIGSASLSGSIGIKMGTGGAYSWVLRDLFFKTFADQAVFLQTGVGGTFTNIWIEGACMKRADHSTYIGGFQLGDASNWFSDAYIEQVASTCSFADAPGGYISGYHCGLYLGLTAGFVNACVGHLSETGFYFPPSVGTACVVTACRADLNQGHGFIIDAYADTFVNCLAYRNGRDADATYSGFLVDGQNCIFSACRIDGLGADTVDQLYGFKDTSGTTTNTYSACKASALITGGLLNPATISTAECYTINIFAEKLDTCNDSETNYWGNAARPPNTTEGWTPVVIPRAGTIKAAYIIWGCDGATSTENVSMYLRVDSSADTLIATVGNDVALKSFNNAALNIPINAGSYFHIKNVFPAWATNPANLYLSGVVYVEVS